MLWNTLKYLCLRQLLALFFLFGLFLLSGYAGARTIPNPINQADKLYQEASKLYNLNQNALSLILYQQAKAIYLSNKVNSTNLVDACFTIGAIYDSEDKFSEALKAYQESVQYQKKLNLPSDSSFAYSYILIGAMFKELNQFDSANVYFNKAELILQRYPKIPQGARLYNNIANLYNWFGNYRQSINYYEKALKANAALADQYEADRYVMYNANIAYTYRKLGYYQKAIAQSKALSQYDIARKEPILRNKLLYNIACSYLQLDQPENAKTFLAQLDLNILLPSERIDYYNSLGRTYTLLQDFPSAVAYFDKAINYTKTNFGSKNDRLATAYSGKGQLYESQNNYPAALKYYQAAIKSLSYNAVTNNVNPAALENTISPLSLFKVLRHKAHALRQYYDQTQKIADLENALRSYQLAFAVADRVRKSYDSDEAKLFFTNTVYPIYEEAIATTFQLFSLTKQKQYQEVAFALAEQGKAAVLAESLRDLKFKQIQGIDPALLQKEKNLKQSIAALNAKLADETNADEKEKFQDQIREYEITLAKVLQAFEKNEQYYNLKYDTNPVKVSQIQAELDNKTALIEYFVGQENLYVFVLTQDDFVAKKLNIVSAFKQQWQQLYQALYTTQSGSRYQGNAPAHQLYQQLILPVATTLSKKQNLIIIQDKELSYLPFEALVSSLKKRYLIQDYNIRYAYSGKLLKNNAGKSYQRSASVLAMAPYANKPATIQANMLSPLYASANEVNQVGVDGQVYVGKAAIKARFANANNYDIVHLATHAQADNQNPLHSYVAFYPTTNVRSSYRLYVPEIYNMQLNNLKLVILSACETGNGQLIQGEGIMSLARAFAYAGCPSIVTTLWKADDKTTAYIATRLHRYLKAGKPKDVALRQAKLDYLKDPTTWQQRSPVYWANFIIIGDQTPVYTNYSYMAWIISGIILALVLLWLFYRSDLANRLFPKRSVKVMVNN